MINSTDKPLITNGVLRVFLFLLAFFLIYFLAAGFINTLGTYLYPVNDSNVWSNITSTIGVWQQVIISLLTSVTSIWLFRKYIDRQSFYSLGWAWKHYQKHFIIGVIAALLMLAAGTTILVAGGWLRFTNWDYSPGFFVNNLLLMLVVALAEELVFRGYILNNLLQHTTKWAALGISATLFAAIHLGNPDVSSLAILEIFIGGVMLGINYIFTKNLWFGIGLHWAWNFLQGPVLGYKVSGVNLPSVLQQQVSGPQWLTGGNFGFEGSVLAMILNVLVTVILAIVYSRNHIEKPV